MDTLEPNPTPALLAAEEARERLREIVEGFFFRRRDEEGHLPDRQLLVRSPPGLGKTTEAMDWATRYQTEQEGKASILTLSRMDITSAGARAQVAIFVPRHELAQEVKAVIERNRERLGEPVEVHFPLPWTLRERSSYLRHGGTKSSNPLPSSREASELRLCGDSAQIPSPYARA